MDKNIVRQDLENIYRRDIDWELLRGKTVLVTGAYGMLASYMVFFLMYLSDEKNMDVEVIAQGRDEGKARAKFQDFWNDSHFVFTDFDISKEIRQTWHVDFIVHAAGIANPQLYGIMPVEVIEPNTLGTWYLLQFAKKNSAEGFLFFSSGDVYGKTDGSAEISERVMGTMDPMEAHSCYGESKRLGETLCAAFFREYGLRTCSARIGHTYGPTMDIYSDPRVFASFMRCVLENRDIEILSDGRACRPFCYIADAAAAFFMLLLKGEGGMAYNVCNSDQFLSIRELAEIMTELAVDKQLRIVYAARDRNDTYMECDANKQNRVVADRLKELGWKCEYTAYEGFKRVYDCLKRQV